MSALGTVLERSAIAVPRLSRRAPLWVAGIGAGGAAVTAIGIGTPSYWGDEAASVMSASRPLWSLWQELGHVDAVHGLYYLFLHFWIQVFGTSEAATRAPSVIAAGIAIAGTVALGTELFGLRRGVIAGVVVTMIPEFTRMAIETRSYAMGVALAVWLTWMLVRLIRRRETRRLPWLAYALLTALSVYLFLYLALLLMVALAVLATERPSGAIVRRWVQAVAVAAVLTIPFVLVAVSQQHQIAFLAHRDYATVSNILQHQWFGNRQLAIVGWVLIILGAVIVVLRARRPGAVKRGAVRPGAYAVIAVWLVGPTAALVAYNEIHPVYNMRYVVFCVPAVAMAIAIGIDGIAGLVRRSQLRVVAIGVLTAVVMATALHTFIAQRGPYAKDGGSDLREIAATIETVATPGDAIVFDSSVVPRRKPRLAIDLYPAAFAAVEDVELVTPYVNRASIWDRVGTVDTLRGELIEHSTVWAVEADGSRSTDLADLARHGFTVVDSIPLHRTTIYELQRTIP